MTDKIVLMTAHLSECEGSVLKTARAIVIEAKADSNFAHKLVVIGPLISLIGHQLEDCDRTSAYLAQVKEEAAAIAAAGKRENYDG